MSEKVYFKLLFLIILFSGLFSKAQYISVKTNFSADQLVKDVFFGSQNSACINVRNIQINGHDFGNGNKSWGYFNKNNSNFDLDEGIILSTGNVLNAVGPNNFIQTQNASSPFADSNWLGDQDLIDALTKANLSTSNILNATVLEFDFTSLKSNKINFDYMFLSEEYDPGNCRYSDAFTFLIKKANNSTQYQNISLIPGTNIPVTSLTINDGQCPKNVQYFGSFNNTQSPTNFNGQTKVLSAKADVELGVTYHIKLVIADEGDPTGLFDSAVFLKAGSFLGNKDLGPDRLISNRNALCANSTLVLDATTSGATYQWYKDNIALNGEKNAIYTVTSSGTYSVIITNPGCNLKGEIKIEYLAAPVLKDLEFTNCDDDFNSQIPVDFSLIIPQVSSDLHGYQLSFYSDSNYVNILPNNWSYGTNTRVYVKAISGIGCAPVTSIIDFKVGTQLPLTKSSYSTSECDDDLDGIKSIDLSKYLSQFTTDPSVNVSYYKNLNDAKNSQNQVSNTVSVNKNGTYYLRLSEAAYCLVIATLNITIDLPKASSVLMDKNICPGTTTVLDAGLGFQSYNWSTGEKTSSITVTAGDYYVDLEAGNGCIYRQKVSVKMVDLPKITTIDIKGSSVTITAEGGNKPYYYSLNGSTPQTSNVFTNVKSGKNTIFVTSADHCTASSKDFSYITITNILTPNGDGFNDTFNYSELKTKDNPKFEIYDRYGKLVFTGAPNNNYTWRGTLNNRKLSTDSYWYILEWQEFGVAATVKYSGWVLLKNSNF